MTDRTKRRLIVFAVAALLLGAAAGAAFWSQRLTAAERAYAGTWYFADVAGDVHELRLLQWRRADIVNGNPDLVNDWPLAASWEVGDGRLTVEYLTHQRTWDRVRQAIDPWAPRALDDSVEFTAKVSPSSETFLTFTGDVVDGKFTVYRTKAEARAALQLETLGDELEPQPEEVP